MPKTVRSLMRLQAHQTFDGEVLIKSNVDVERDSRKQQGLQAGRWAWAAWLPQLSRRRGILRELDDGRKLRHALDHHPIFRGLLGLAIALRRFQPQPLAVPITDNKLFVRDQLFECDRFPDIIWQLNIDLPAGNNWVRQRSIVCRFKKLQNDIFAEII